MPPTRGTRETIQRGKALGTFYDNGHPPVVVWESIFVNPSTLQPFDDNRNPEDEPAIRGQTRLVIKYRKRDSEQWIRSYSYTLTASGKTASTVSLSGLSANIPDATEVAIGLEPVATRPGYVDYGRLTITSNPVVNVQSLKTPSVVISDPITARHLNGSLRNVRTGKILFFTDLFFDEVGLEINTTNKNLSVGGVGGVGPHYGQIGVTGGMQLFELMPGSNAWAVTGDLGAIGAGIGFEWDERVAF